MRRGEKRVTTETRTKKRGLLGVAKSKSNFSTFGCFFDWFCRIEAEIKDEEHHSAERGEPESDVQSEPEENF